MLPRAQVELANVGLRLVQAATVSGAFYVSKVPVRRLDAVNKACEASLKVRSSVDQSAKIVAAHAVSIQSAN